MILTTIILASIIAAGGPLAWFERVKLVKKVKAAESKHQASEEEIRARVSEDIHKVLNELRNDEQLLETHAYSIISRVREDLRDIL